MNVLFATGSPALAAAIAQTLTRSGRHVAPVTSTDEFDDAVNELDKHIDLIILDDLTDAALIRRVLDIEDDAQSKSQQHQQPQQHQLPQHDRRIPQTRPKLLLLATNRLSSPASASAKRNGAGETSPTRESAPLGRAAASQEAASSTTTSSATSPATAAAQPRPSTNRVRLSSTMKPVRRNPIGLHTPDADALAAVHPDATLAKPFTDAELISYVTLLTELTDDADTMPTDQLLSSKVPSYQAVSSTAAPNAAPNAAQNTAQNTAPTGPTPAQSMAATTPITAAQPAVQPNATSAADMARDTSSNAAAGTGGPGISEPGTGEPGTTTPGTAAAAQSQRMPRLLIHGDLTLDTTRHRAYWQGSQQPLALSPREYKTLELLVVANGEFLTFDELLERVCGTGFFEQRDIMDGVLYSLTRKLRRLGFFITQRGRRYRIR